VGKALALKRVPQLSEQMQSRLKECTMKLFNVPKKAAPLARWEGERQTEERSRAILY
jgi:hypothetical protein